MAESDLSLGEIPKLRLTTLLNKPVLCADGALLPVGGVTFSLSSGKIRHIIVKMGAVLQSEDVSELYLPFSTARFSAWRIAPASDRTCSPKGTQRLILGKPLYSTGGTYYGKLTDVLIKNGILKLFYTENGVFSAENLYAAGDALLFRLPEPYPIGQKIPVNTHAQTRTGTSVRFSKQVTRAALHCFLREGRLIEFTTSLPLFCKK